MSNFKNSIIITSLQESFTKVIQKHQSMQLTSKDTEAFLDAILNPTEPNENFKVAAAEYKKTIRCK